MAADDNFLSRWSRRKIQARTSPQEAAPPPQPAAVVPAEASGAAAPLPDERAPLPPVESLTPESDFLPFMSPEVDGEVRRKALKTLFGDPRFNVMDMMDVYVDDYSKPDPLPASWLAKMEQMSWLGDRAGRDREEAERRKALAEARDQAPAGTQAGPVIASAGTPGDEASADGEPVPHAEAEGTEADTPSSANPPSPLRESGA